MPSYKISYDEKEHERNEEIYDSKFDVKDAGHTYRPFYSVNRNHSIINFSAYSVHGLFSQVIIDGLGNVLSALGKQLFVFLKKKITERYGDIAVVNRLVYKAGVIFLSDINTSFSRVDAFHSLLNDPEFSSFFSDKPQLQGWGINSYLLLFIKLIYIWNDMKHIREKPVKVLLLALPKISRLLIEDVIITEWNRKQATEWASLINATLPWVNFYDQQTTKPTTSLGDIISALYEERQALLPGWLSQLVDSFEKLFREVKQVLSTMDSHMSDYAILIAIAGKINNSHTFGGRVSNVIYFFTNYDEEKSELINKIKADLSPETQSFLSEWQAVYEINAWFRAEVGGSKDTVTAMKALEILTDQKSIAQLRAKTTGTQSEKWLAAYQTTSSEWFQPGSVMSVTLRTAIRLFRKELSWREFLLMTAGEINAQNLIWKAVTGGSGLLLTGKGGNADKLSRLAMLVKQYHEGTSLADLLLQDMQQALEGKSLLVDLASVMTGINLSQYLEQQQWIQDAVKAISEWHLSHDHDQLLMQLSQLTTKQEGNAWWIAGILLKGIILFRLWQNYQHRDVDTNFKKSLLKLMPNMPENWIPWVLELCDWLPVLIKISRRREHLLPLSVNQNWLSWSCQMMAEAGQDDDLLLKKIMPWIGGYQQQWLMNLLKFAGFKNFAGLEDNAPRSAGQPSADAIWGALSTATTQGRNLSHWINQAVGSAKRVALPLSTLIFLEQIVQANASGTVLSTLSNSGNSTLPPQGEMFEASSGYLSVLPALVVAGGSGVYYHLRRFFPATSTDPIPTDPELQGKYTFDAELQEVNARLEDSSESWLPAALLSGGLTTILGGVTWAAHTFNKTNQPEQKVDETEMLTMPSESAFYNDIEAQNDELSSLNRSVQETKSEDKQQGISTRGSARNTYLLSGFIAGAGVISAIASGILYWRHQRDVHRKTELENIIEFNAFDNSEFTARVAKKLVELVSENFAIQANDYDVRLAVEEVLLEGDKTKTLPKSTTFKPRLEKRSLPVDANENNIKTSDVLQASTDLSSNPLFIAALKHQLQATENDSGSGLRKHQDFVRYSGWEVSIGHNINKKAVGSLRALEYSTFPNDCFFLLKLMGGGNTILYEKYYKPDDDSNTPDKYRKNLFDKINTDIDESYLESKNKVKIVSVSYETYLTKRPLAVSYPDNSLRNFFVVPENSGVRSADWSIVTKHRKILLDKSKDNSSWIRRTLQQKNEQYIRQHYIAQESLKVDHAIGNLQYAQSVINKIQDGIYHTSGAYIDDFKSEISSFVGSVYEFDFDEDKYYELLDEKVTYTYYESKHTGPLPAPFSTFFMINSDDEYKLRVSNLTFSYAKKVTVTETFWEFLLKRRDFFENRDGGIAPGGQRITLIRSGTATGSTYELLEFKFNRFHKESIPPKAWSLINNDTYLRIEGEKYINKAFRDAKFRVYSNLLMDIYLANTLDKVIAKDYVEGLSIPDSRKTHYANLAKKMRAGKFDVILLQHKSYINERITGDRLILIPDVQGNYYLALSLGAGTSLQKEIKLERYEDGYRVNDNTIDFLENFFPKDSLSKFRKVNAASISSQLNYFQTRGNYKDVWDKFYIQKSNNPLEDLMTAHKRSRLDMIGYIFESKKELDAKKRKRIYDDLLTGFTLLTFAIPVLEPLAVEMLALRGAAVEIVNSIANVTARVLNVSSLGLGIISSWEEYLSKKSRPKEAMEAWSSFVDTITINLILASTEFFPGMPEEERYDKAVRQVQEDADMSEASQIINNCKRARSPFDTACTIGSKKVADMANLYAAGNKIENIDRIIYWNFVIDLQRKAKAIGKDLSTTLKSTTRTTQFGNYLGKDPLHITSIEMLSEIPLGSRLAFTEISPDGQEEIKHAMVSVGNKKVVGVNNSWLTTGGTTRAGSSVTTIDLENDITWTNNQPCNKDGRHIDIYAQSVHDLQNPEALSTIYNFIQISPGPERYMENFNLTIADKINISESFSIGEYYNPAIKANFIKGKEAAKEALPVGIDTSIISNELGAVESMERLKIASGKKFYHGNSVSENCARIMKKGDLLQSHQFTSLSDSQYVSRFFSELSDGPVKVIYELNNVESGVVRKITPSRDLYNTIKNSYESLGSNVQNEVMEAKEGIIPPGYVYRIKSVKQTKIAGKPYLRVKLEYIHKNDKVLPTSFAGNEPALLQSSR